MTTFSRKDTPRPKDNPLLRFKASVLDKLTGSEGQMLAEKYLIAMKQVRKMQSVSGNDTIGKWEQLGPTSIPKGQAYSQLVRARVSGRVTSIVPDPKNPETLYIGTAQGGIWKTKNGGKEWTAISDMEPSLAIGALVIDETNPAVLYAGTGEGNGGGATKNSMYGRGILKTTNGGQTWQVTGKNEKGQNAFQDCRFYRLAISSKTKSIFAAVSSESTEHPHTDKNIASGIYRSNDNGDIWIRMENGLPSIADLPDWEYGATDIVLDPSNPGIAYAAFWGRGVYKTTEAGTATPKWTPLTNGLPYSLSPSTATFGRIAIGISKSSPSTLYAIMSDPMSDPEQKFRINKFFWTKDGGDSWNKIEINTSPEWWQWGFANGDFGINGFYNINLAVHPNDENTVYVGGITLWKVSYDQKDWIFKTIGDDMHSDHHAFAFNPTNPEVIYAGNDGGIYKSEDGGNTWDDKINEGLCITQFEFMEQHPTSDDIIFVGTQDGGTLRYQGNPEFEHVDDGDGGFVCIDPRNPDDMWHTRDGPSPLFSDKGGVYDSWIPIGIPLHKVSQSDIGIKSLFYPPLTLDKTNTKNKTNNIALGASILMLDGNKGRDGWPDRIGKEEGLVLEEDEFISIINYVRSDLIYLGTDHGGIYRVEWDGNNGKWEAGAIHSAPFPHDHYVTDIATIHNDSPNGLPTVIATISGFDVPHVWKGTTNNNKTRWEAIGPDINIPFNAVVVDSNDSNKRDTIYVGADIGVYRTDDGGKMWMPLEGLPNCQVYDMRLSRTGFLRIVTHGRGMWQRRVV